MILDRLNLYYLNSNEKLSLLLLLFYSAIFLVGNYGIWNLKKWGVYSFTAFIGITRASWALMGEKIRAVSLIYSSVLIFFYLKNLAKMS